MNPPEASSSEACESGRSPLDLIEDVIAGRISPKLIGREDRIECVACLWERGATVMEIARTFKVHSRTITRDRNELRERAAVKASAKLRAEVAGQVYQTGLLAQERLNRLYHDKAASPSLKLKIIKAQTSVFGKTVKTMKEAGALGGPAAGSCDEPEHKAPAGGAVLQAEVERVLEVSGPEHRPIVERAWNILSSDNSSQEDHRRAA